MTLFAGQCPPSAGTPGVGLRPKKPVSLSMNEGLRVSRGGCTWARMRDSGATRVAAERLRAEDQLETLAADAHSAFQGRRDPWNSPHLGVGGRACRSRLMQLRFRIWGAGQAVGTRG
jgi:hypothetical protein